MGVEPAARIARQRFDLAAGFIEAGAADVVDLELGDGQRVVLVVGIDLDAADGEVLEGESIRLDVQLVGIGKRRRVGQIVADEQFGQCPQLDEIDAARLEVGAQFARSAALCVTPPEPALDGGVADPRGDLVDRNAPRPDVGVAGEIERREQPS